MRGKITPFLEWYQKNNLSFFPVPFRSKQPNIEWKVYQERLPTEEEISRWKNIKETNIAVVCGKISGNLTALDCDSIERFYELAEVICKHTGIEDILDFTTISQTSKGMHIWLRTKEPIKSQKFPKLDVKGEGGYIIAPNSIHPSGAEYKFINKTPIKTIDTLEAIGININQQPTEMPRKGAGWVSQILTGVGEGQRNDSAIKLAGYFRNIMPRDITERLMLDWNTKNIPPMMEREIFRTIESAYTLPEHPNGPYYNGPQGSLYNNSIYIRGDKLDIEGGQVSYEGGDKRGTKGGQEGDKGGQEGIRGDKGGHFFRIIAQVVREWISETDGRWFSSKELDSELSILSPLDKEARKKALHRLKVDGIVEKHPSVNYLFRFVNSEADILDFKSAGADNIIAIKWPFRIEDYVDLYPGNLAVVAGSPSAGKTALLLNVARNNMGQFDVVFFSSEMAKEELRRRIDKFGIELEDWRVDFRERATNFPDVIRPNALNIIDYLELTQDVFLVAEHLANIQRKLKTGIAIIALQKKIGASLGRGAEFSLEKPRLYLSMDKGRITIVKGKNWHIEGQNPDGLESLFKLVAGCNFIITRPWQHTEF